MLNLVRFWILLSSTLVGGGWILSALHQLNRAGYAVVLSPLALVVFLRWRKSRPLAPENLRRGRWKFLKRFRRRPPRFFLLIAALSLLAGCLYPALNWDANAYRLPRVMLAWPRFGGQELCKCVSRGNTHEHRNRDQIQTLRRRL